jgi:hypothetical protein
MDQRTYGLRLSEKTTSRLYDREELGVGRLFNPLGG